MHTITRACLAVLVILLVAYAAMRFSARRPHGVRDGFYTEHAREEPTRSETPYTGSIPLGPWGVKPWAEVTSPR